MSDESDEIRAAGGIVSRLDPGGETEVLLVHRAHRRDWTFPKGKVEADESDEACALREVEEETGLTCVLEAELSPTSYRDHKGRRKTVRYWKMRPVAGAAGPRNEIDAVQWVSLAAAARILSYQQDKELLTTFARGLASRGGRHPGEPS